MALLKASESGGDTWRGRERQWRWSEWKLGDRWRARKEEEDNKRAGTVRKRIRK